MADQKQTHPANTDADHSAMQKRSGDSQSAENKTAYSGSGDNHWEVQSAVDGSSTNEAYEGYESNQRDIGGFSSETGAYRGNYGEREDPTNDVQRDPSQGGPYLGKIDNVREQNNSGKQRPGDSAGGSRT